MWQLHPSAPQQICWILRVFLIDPGKRNSMLSVKPNSVFLSVWKSNREEEWRRDSYFSKHKKRTKSKFAKFLSKSKITLICNGKRKNYYESINCYVSKNAPVSRGQAMTSAIPKLPYPPLLGSPNIFSTHICGYLTAYHSNDEINTLVFSYCWPS